MAPPFDGGGQAASAMFDKILKKLHHRGKLKRLKYSKRSVREISGLTFGQHINIVSRTISMAQICGTEEPDSAKTLADVS